MSRRKIRLKYKKERAVLSEVLPYEVPLTFSNRHFYDFILSNNIEIQENQLFWKKDDDALNHLVKLLFGIADTLPLITTSKNHHGTTIDFCSYDLSDPKKNPAAYPFVYKISHKEKEFRDLVVPHPLSQISIVAFYHSFKETILYYCSLSNFSIRRPARLAKITYYKDKIHYDALSNEGTMLEQHDKEYENLRSFFVYKDYSNVYKFYESYKYHRCEKKYNGLLKLDISKCFDSIYTHSVVWALLGKDKVKENLSSSKQTFPGKFDRLMQGINYNETNGIIIGPEISRIFAELILQAVDKAVEETLFQTHHVVHKVDYEIFRYVDDYFIFYDKDQTKDLIVEILQ